MSFRIAEKIAKQSPHHQHKLGAVIVKGNRILSTGYNSLRSSSIIGTPTLHAESAAILKLLKEGRQTELVGTDIYVTRFTRGGSVGMAKPCMACADLIRSVGIRRCFYSTQLGTTEEWRVH
jgi:deoxycytidylate deaminase